MLQVHQVANFAHLCNQNEDTVCKSLYHDFRRHTLEVYRSRVYAQHGDLMRTRCNASLGIEARCRLFVPPMSSNPCSLQEMYSDVRNSPSKGKAKQDARYWQSHWWDFHPLAEHLQRLLPKSSPQVLSNFHLLEDPSRGLLPQQYSPPTLLSP
jgi:hypothetical protein